MKCQIINLSKENKGNLYNVGVAEDFLNRTQKRAHHRKKLINWTMLKIKNFCSSKDTIKRVKTTHKVRKDILYV